jgi:hypothetical protein
MKRNLKIFAISAFLVIAPLLMFAQTPPHPNNGGTAPTPGGNTPVGGSAPLDDGVFILASLAIAYGSRKIYMMRKGVVKE